MIMIVVGRVEFEPRREDMKKTLAAVFTTALLATIPLAVSSQSAQACHKPWHCFGQGVAGGVGIGVGLGITNKILNPNPPPPPNVVYVQPAPPQTVVVQGGRSQAHYNDCRRRYNSYDWQSNSWQPFGNVPRRLCYSPY